NGESLTSHSNSKRRPADDAGGARGSAMNAQKNGILKRITAAVGSSLGTSPGQKSQPLSPTQFNWCIRMEVVVPKCVPVEFDPSENGHLALWHAQWTVYKVEKPRRL